MTFLYHSILKEISRFTVFVITKKSQWFFNLKNPKYDSSDSIIFFEVIKCRN